MYICTWKTINRIKIVVTQNDLRDRAIHADFTLQVPQEIVNRKDEIGTLAKVFENMILSMRMMIGQVGNNATQVAAAAQQISATTEEIASGSTSQANDAPK
jgi:methyl-accepting chemotaxis protein